VSRLLAVLLALALALALPLAAPATAGAAGLETVVQDDRMLLHRPADEVRAAMAELRGLGVDRVRLTAMWSTLTRDADAEARPAFDARDPAAYEQARWRGLDTAVRLAREAGLGVVVDVGFWGPRWATEGDPPGPRARSNVDPQAFADFTVAVARRYSGSFRVPVTAAVEGASEAAAEPPPSQDDTLIESVFGPPRALRQAEPAPAATAAPGEPLPAVDRFILWNEPNHPGLLLPQWDGERSVSPDRYRALVRAAYPAAKAVRPDAAFLIGNTSSLGGTEGSAGVSPLRFVRELACVDVRLRPLQTPSCRGYQPLPGDGFAHHPYARNEPPDRRIGRADDVGISDVGRLVALLRTLAASGRVAPGLRQVHLTEFGYETGAIAGRRRLSEETQAQWLTWAEAIATRAGVASFAQFLLRDQPPSPVRLSESPARGFGQYYSGLHTVDGRPKLAAQTFRAGLFAQREGTRGVRLFGRLRLGDGPLDVTVERSVRGRPWREVARLRVGGRDAFDAAARWARGARYRLTWPGPNGARVAGAAVPAVRPSPPPGAVAVRQARLVRRGGWSVAFRVAEPGRVSAVVRVGRRVLARGARTTVESDPFRVVLRRTAAGRRSRATRAVLEVAFRSADGPVSRARRRVVLRRAAAPRPSARRGGR